MEVFQKGIGELTGTLSEYRRFRQEYPLTPCEKAVIKIVSLGLLIAGNEPAQAFGLGMMVALRVEENMSRNPTTKR